MKKIIYLILFLLLSCIIFVVFDGIFDDELPRKNTAYGVIYGSKVELNGEPSNRLKERLNAGLKLYEYGKVQKLIVSGGIGDELFDESLIMNSYLIKHGVKEEDIFIDNDGYTTNKTSINAFEIISKLEGNMSNISIIGISQYFHISRVKLSLEKSGFKNVYGIAPKYFEIRDIYSILREIPAYFKYKIL